jgi:hypothetical protein
MISATVKGLPEILLELKRLESIFDLDRQDLGRQLLEITTQSILANMAMEVSFDGTPWPALSPDYETWKQGEAPGAPMAELYGHMKTYEQIKGEQHITSQIAQMDYGVDDLARLEASWFAPRRPFYGLTDDAEHRSEDVLNATFQHGW